jgi:alpha-amylase
MAAFCVVQNISITCFIPMCSGCRKEVGYDGWRLDFVRGFWGGYVKDYLEASEPYFAVGEYWDSLSYTYGEMDYNQDAHRQRIVDWINATNGTAGAFDVTTKGILHAVRFLYKFSLYSYW